MVKHRKHKSKACTASVHKKGHFVEVRAKCHVGKAKLTTASACKQTSRKTTKRRKARTPRECKGLHGKSLKECKKIMHKEYYNK